MQAYLLALFLLQQHTPDNDKNPFAGNASAIAAGAAQYKQVCQSCHGGDGRGDRGPALAGRAYTHGGKDGEIFLTIRDGLAGTQMPSFKAFSADQLWQLVAYVRSLPGPVAVASSKVSEDTYSLATRDDAGRLHLLDKQTHKEAVVPSGGLSFERIRNSKAEPQNWLSYWGDYQGTHYSALPQITTSNVHTLQAQWAVQMPGDSVVESTPLVVDGVMYTTGPPGQVFALDARTGRRLWKYERKQKVVNPYEGNRFARGVSMLGGRLFFGTLDAALIALDAGTGEVLWEIQVADTMQGYSITSPPLVLRDKIIVGIGGGEYGIRGFLDAYDPATGKRLWRFNSVPGPGEFGNDTWLGESWKRGSGATWLTGSYDPDLDVIYWAVGNPGPGFDGTIRRGDNLFTCSVVALDPTTGQRKWHYQFTPADTHDWDSTEDMMLVDVGGKKLLWHADRNGYFYTLDRASGKFVSATPFVRATWASGFDASGRPIVTSGDAVPEGSAPTSPDIAGGTNFQAPSYSPQTGWFYLAYRETEVRYVRTPAPFEEGKQYWSGKSTPSERPESAGIRAINPATGKIMWDYPLFRGSLANGVLATAGGVLFAATQEGNFIALDARTGKPLWRFQTGAGMAASPMSYSIDGRQYVAIAAGNVLYSFALPQ